MQHSITLLLGQIALTLPRGLFGVNALLENKKNGATQCRQDRMVWNVAAKCYGQVSLQFSYSTVSPTKPPQTITLLLHAPPPPQREPRIQEPSVHSLSGYQRTKNQQTKGQFSTDLIFIDCISRPKQVFSACCFSEVIVSSRQFDHEGLTQSPVERWVLKYVCREAVMWALL